MSVEVRPLNVLCNIQCHYCYQDPQRYGSKVPRNYDMTKIKEAIDLEGQAFTLFGGEPLLLPLDDLEELWAYGFERYGRNSVQTNGTLVSDDHIKLFHKYKVAIGISVDGPGELNDARWHGDLAKTRESSAKTEAAIRRLCAEGLNPALIITLHRLNAAADRLPRLTAWVTSLGAAGVRHFRLHLLESESEAVRARYGLSMDENVQALLAFLELERERPELGFDMFAEMRRLLMGDDRRVQCIWNACDPYTTRAVRGIEGQGQRSNCGRTNKDGVDFAKGPVAGFERYIALYHTPQDAGGCQGCRFFLMCKGQCPGTAIDGDWRNRTEHCEVWMRMFEHLERDLLASGSAPLSVDRTRPVLEQRALKLWADGENVAVADLRDQLRRIMRREVRP